MDICSAGPLPEVDHNSECDSDSDFGSPGSENEALSMEEGNHILATRLLPPLSVDIQASSMISQRLAETYQANAEVLNPVPEYLKEFTSMFSKMSFNVLPEPKEWDHAVELIPRSKSSSHKVYPLSPAKQKELDVLKENLKTSQI